MRTILAFIVLALFCAGMTSAQTCNVQYFFSNYTLQPSAVKLITLTPIRPLGNYTGVVLVPTPIARTTDTSGQYTYSNVVSGYSYSIDLFDGTRHYTQTNAFPAGLTGTVNAQQYIGFWSGQIFSYFTATNFTITTNYFNVTNGIAGGSGTATNITGYATNQVVQLITNYNYATVIDLNTASNWVRQTFYPTSNPSLFVTAAVTNGLATVGFVNTNPVASSNLTGTIIASIQGDISGATNYQGTNVIGTIPALVLSNQYILQQVTNVTTIIISNSITVYTNKLVATNDIRGVSLGNGFVSWATNVVPGGSVVSLNYSTNKFGGQLFGSYMGTLTPVFDGVQTFNGIFAGTASGPLTGSIDAGSFSNALFAAGNTGTGASVSTLTNVNNIFGTASGGASRLGLYAADVILQNGVGDYYQAAAGGPLTIHSVLGGDMSIGNNVFRLSNASFYGNAANLTNGILLTNGLAAYYSLTNQLQGTNAILSQITNGLAAYLDLTNQLQRTNAILVQITNGLAAYMDLTNEIQSTNLAILSLVRTNPVFYAKQGVGAGNGFVVKGTNGVIFWGISGVTPLFQNLDQGNGAIFSDSVGTTTFLKIASAGLTGTGITMLQSNVWLVVTNNIATASNNLALSVLVSSNQMAYDRSQINLNTNYLMTSTAGTANIQGTNVWAGTFVLGVPIYTNINGVTWITNDVAGCRIVQSGAVNVYGSVGGFPNGPWTNINGSLPVPTTYYAQFSQFPDPNNAVYQAYLATNVFTGSGLMAYTSSNYWASLFQATNIVTTAGIASKGGIATNIYITNGIAIQVTNLTVTKLVSIQDANFSGGNLTNVSYILFNPANVNGTIIAGASSGNSINQNTPNSGIVMGQSNQFYNVPTENSLILGGKANVFNGNTTFYAIIAGGLQNTNRGGQGAFMAAGVSNLVALSGSHAFVAGSQAAALHTDTTVINDMAAPLQTTGTNQILLGAAGGVMINTNVSAATFTVNGSASATMGYVVVSNSWSLNSVTSGVPNFATIMNISSNGVPLNIYMSNSIPFYYYSTARQAP